MVRIVVGAIIVLLGVANLLGGLFGGGSNAGLQVALGALIIFFGVTVLGSLIARPAAWLIGAPLPWLRGTIGRLARENAMRNPKRTASTAAALMIGVGLVGFVTIFAASATASVNHVIDSEMKADYIVNTAGPGSSLPPSIEAELAKIPGRGGGVRPALRLDEGQRHGRAGRSGRSGRRRPALRHRCEQGRHRRPRPRRHRPLQEHGQGQPLDDRLPHPGAVRRDGQVDAHGAGHLRPAGAGRLARDLAGELRAATSSNRPTRS